MNIQKSLVRILASNGQTSGTGFLVNDGGLIITASHVILNDQRQLMNEPIPKTVQVEFYEEKIERIEQITHEVRVLHDYWKPFLQGDIAILQFDGILPKEVESYPLGQSTLRMGNYDDIKTFGFPSASAEIGKGCLLGKVWDNVLKMEVLQISSEEIVPGFSGAPVLNLDTHHIIGIISYSRKQKKTFIIPSEEIVKVYDLPLLPAFSESKIIELSAPRIFKKYEDLEQQSTFIANLKRQTIDFIELIARFRSRPAKESIISYHLAALFSELNFDLPSKDFWAHLLFILQYNKVSKILKILDDIGKYTKDIDTFNELISKWTAVSKSPYQNIFRDYLERIVNSPRLIEFDKVYLDLKVEQDNSAILEPMAVEQSSMTLSYNSNWEDDDKPNKKGKLKEENKTDAPKIDYILNIAEAEDRFVMIGAPGSGKSFTLNKILIKNAKKVLDNDPLFKLPILIITNQFSEKKSINDLITEKIKDWNNPDLDKSKFVLLLDGINEITPNKQKEAKEEIAQMLRDYEGTSFVISSRKYGFKDSFKLPIFELKDLQGVQVKAYIENYIDSSRVQGNVEEKAEYKKNIWAEINDDKNKKTNSLAYNPLTLFMLIFTYNPVSKRILPPNRGSLFGKYIDKILPNDDNIEKYTTDVSVDVIKDLLSELGLSMRRDAMHPKLIKVKKFFEHRLKRNEKDTVNTLIDDLCNNYILQLDTINDEVIDAEKLTITDAEDEATISFKHECYLEYFCALELKRSFLLNEVIDVDFTATEWFETILMSSDLFSDPEGKDITKFLVKLYFANTPRSYNWKTRHISYQKKQVNIFKILDYDNFDTDNFFFRFEIACKVAYNIREKFPKAYHLIEYLLEKDLQLWYNYNLHHVTKIKQEVVDEVGNLDLRLYYEKMKVFHKEEIKFPLRYILAAAGGLGSEKIFRLLFFKKNYQLSWLLSLPENYGNNFANIDALIENLSNFELLYTMIIEPDYRIEWGEKMLNHLKGTFIRKMPLDLQKRLFEGNNDLQLLERIGRQDLDYYMDKFDTEKFPVKFPIESFATYLLSFAYNKKVQQKLLRILFSKDNKNIQLEILKSLMKKFYCIPDVILYLENNIEMLNSNPSLAEEVKSYISALPLSLIPNILIEQFFDFTPTLTNEKEVEKVLLQKKFLMQNNSGQINLIRVKESRTVSDLEKVGYCYFEVENATNIEIAKPITVHISKTSSYVFRKLRISGSKKTVHLILDITPEDFQALPTTGQVVISESITEDIFGKAKVNKDYSIVISKKNINKIINSTLVDKHVDGTTTFSLKINGQEEIKQEGHFQTLDKSVSIEYFYLDILDKKLYFNSSTYPDFEQHFKLEDSFLMGNNHFTIKNIGKSVNATYQKITNEYHLERVIDGAVIDKNSGNLLSLTPIHVDLLKNNEILQKEITKSITSPPIQQFLIDSNATYLFESYLENVHYGITMKLIPDLNKVIYYSQKNKSREEVNVDDEVLHYNTPKGRVRELYLNDELFNNLQQNQIIIIEDNLSARPLLQKSRSGRVGFLKSFINGINEVDETNRYLFIYNFTGKDYFLPRSFIKFFPQKYDIVTFYPTHNLSSQYQNYPLATLVKKVGEADISIYDEISKNKQLLVEKYVNAIKIDKENIYNYNKLGDIYFREKDYEKCERIAKKMLQIDFRNVEAHILLGDVYYEKFDTESAIEHYRKVVHKMIDNPYFIERLLYCYAELQKVNSLTKLAKRFFKENGFISNNLFLQETQLNILLDLNRTKNVERIISNISKHNRSFYGDILVKTAKVLSSQSSKYLKVIDYFEEGIGYEPSAKNFLHYAIFLYKVGDFQKSENYFKKAVELSTSPMIIEIKYHQGLAAISTIYISKNMVFRGGTIEAVNKARELLKSDKILQGAKLLKSILKRNRRHKKGQKVFKDFIHKLVKRPKHQASISLDYIYSIEHKKSLRPFLIKYEYVYTLYLNKKYEKTIFHSKKLLENALKFESEVYNLIGNCYKMIGLKYISKDEIKNENIRHINYVNALDNYDLAIEKSNTDELKCKYIHNKMTLILDLKIEAHYSKLIELYEQGVVLNPDFKWLRPTRIRIKQLLNK